MEKSQVLEQIIIDIFANDSLARICTDQLTGYAESQPIETYKPDIEVFSRDTHNLIEVQLTSDFQISKWKTFSEYSKKDKSKEFHIVVPSTLKNDAKDVLVEHDIDAQLLYF